MTTPERDGGVLDFVITRKTQPDLPPPFICAICERTIEADPWWSARSPHRHHPPLCITCTVHNGHQARIPASDAKTLRDASAALRSLASRTQEPAEWQVEAMHSYFENSQFCMTNPVPIREDLRAALRAASITPPASIPAPERKEEVGTQRGRHLWVMEEIAATLLTGDRSAATKLREAIDFFSALEPASLHREGEVEYVTVDHKGCIFHSKDMDGIARIAKANLEAAVAAASPAPLPVTMTMTDEMVTALMHKADDLDMCMTDDDARELLTAALSKPGEQG